MKSPRPPFRPRFSVFWHPACGGYALRIATLLTIVHAGAAEQEPARLLRQPAVGEQHIAFVYADDVWIVARGGGQARRLTTFQGSETDPHFSPDGQSVAFSGEYDGNTDVYVVSVDGGEPRRLTWHPGPDTARGWTTDGTHVLFASGRTNVPRPWPRLWSVARQDAIGLPEPLPIPRVADGHLSPDGASLAYQMIEPWESEWRNYRGGQANPIRIIDLKTLDVSKLPWKDSNDLSPAWVGDTIFFLSDRDLVMNVWAYDVRTKRLTQRTHFKDFDCKSLEGGSGTLVFENGGYVYSMEASGGQAQRLNITLGGDFSGSRPHWVEVSSDIRVSSVSPKGKRAVFEARGDIFTVPAKKGDVRNLTRSSGTAERSPAWSPDGKWISWFSDDGGEYRLVIADQFGKEPRVIALDNATFYYTPRWSPDSSHIAFGDADRNLWVVNVDTQQARLVDNEGFAHPIRRLYPEWSPDSKWIAYSRRLENQYNAVFVYSLDSGQSTRLTDGLSDSHSPAWDKGGEYLYFLAGTDFGLNVGWLDMSSFNQPQNHAIYVAVLSREEPSPLAPESDDEEIDEPDADDDEAEDADTTPGDDAEDGDDDEDEKEEEEEEEEEEDNKDGEDQDQGSDGDQKDDDDKDKDSKTPDVKIDFEGIDQRIIALGVPARPYESLSAGAKGTLFYVENIENQPGVTLHRYTFEDREAKPVISGILGYEVSADAKKLLYSMPDDNYFIVDAAGEPGPGKGKLALDHMRMKVDPAAEWRQIFKEAWRYQRDYFYVENVHGLDLDWAYDTYAPWVAHVRHRTDLTYILDILGGETAIGHSFTGGGDEPEVESVPVGMLGADFVTAGGHYRIEKIYTGENWNPDLRAPLSGPGIDARVGDYLIAVDGFEIKADTNLYSMFDRTAGRQTVLTLNEEPSAEGAREVTVVPVSSDTALRQRDWIEGNRRRVDELSGGRLAYVWIPDTGQGGYTNFTRYYFAQMNKQGAIIDERFNHGGSIADYIVDLMSRELLGYFNNPVGGRQPFTAPNAAIWGPKVMLINEMSGSGGDMLPYMFRMKKIGPLVGTRTWGGLVGIWDVPPLIDGGFITAPRGGFYNIRGQWEVENEGVAPDVEVEQLPKLVQAGHDPQLEKAVEIALELLAKQPVELLPQPPDPVRARRPE